MAYDECNYGIPTEVAFTTAHQFSTIKTAFFTAFGTFYRLAVCDHGAGLRLLAFCFSNRFPDGCVDLLSQAGLSKLPKVVVDRFPRRKIVRQGTPDTAVLDDIKNGIQDRSPAMLSRRSCRTWLWQVWRNSRPFSIIQIGRVGLL